MYFSFLLLTVVFSFFGGVSSARTAGVEVYCTNSYTYFRLESNFVYIKLKSQPWVTIVLAETPFSSWSNDRVPSDGAISTAPFYKFSLRHASSLSRFEVNGEVKVEMAIPKVLPGDQFEEFVIHWFNDFLIFSRFGDPLPIFYWKDVQSNLDTIKYVGIRSDGDRNPDAPILENHWEINFSSPMNFSEAFALYFNSSLNRLLMTEFSKDTPNISAEKTFDSSTQPSSFPSSTTSTSPGQSDWWSILEKQ